MVNAMIALAVQVNEMTASPSELRFIPYEQACEAGFGEGSAGRGLPDHSLPRVPSRISTSSIEMNESISSARVMRPSALRLSAACERSPAAERRSLSWLMPIPGSRCVRARHAVKCKVIHIFTRTHKQERSVTQVMLARAIDAGDSVSTCLTMGAGVEPTAAGK